MATAQPIAPSSVRRKRRRLWLIPVVILGGVVAWFWHPLHSYAVTGASFGARVGCSCRYVEGRALGDCRKDFEPGMALVRLSEDETAKNVTASFPLLSRQTATFREGEGCVLERWEN